MSDAPQPPNMALQRTRRPRLRSGRSLCSLGSPLNAQPLDARWLILASALSLLGSSAESGAQNLVVNGDFPSSLSGWQLEGSQGGSASWTPVDVANLSSSGSALIVNDQPCVEQSPGVFSCPFPGLVQCIPVVPGASYSIGFSSLIPSGQGVGGAAYLFLDWYSGDACDAGPLSHPVFGHATVGSWGSEIRGLTAPASARSLRLTLAAVRDEISHQGSFRAHFDNVFVNGPNQVAAVPALSGYGLAVLVLAIAIAGYALIGGRGIQG
jgi:hypothetical protein